MTTEAEIGYGTVLQMGDGGNPEAFTDVGEVKDPGSLDITSDAVDATHSRSPNGRKEYIPGLVSHTYTCTVAYVPGSVQHLAIMAKLRVKSNWRLLHDNPEATAWTFSGILTQANHAMPLEDTKTLALTFQISGEPTLDNLA